MMISHYLPFSGLSRIRTYSVYPMGPDLQSGAEPKPSLQSTQIFYDSCWTRTNESPLGREGYSLQELPLSETAEFLGLSPSVYPFYPIQRLPQGTGQSVKKKSRRLRCDLIKFYNKNLTSRDTPYNTWNNRTSSSELMTMNMNKSVT